MSLPTLDAPDVANKRQHRGQYDQDSILSTLSPNLGRSSVSSFTEHDLPAVSFSDPPEIGSLRLPKKQPDLEESRSSSSQTFVDNARVDSDSSDLNEMVRQFQDISSLPLPPQRLSITSAVSTTQDAPEMGRPSSHSLVHDQTLSNNTSPTQRLPETTIHPQTPRSPSATSEMFATPATHMSSKGHSITEDVDEVDYGDTTLEDESHRQQLLSSPSAAAAQRRNTYPPGVAAITHLETFESDSQQSSFALENGRLDSSEATPTQEGRKSLQMNIPAPSRLHAPLWPSGLQINPAATRSGEHEREEAGLDGNMWGVGRVSPPARSQSGEDDSDSWLGTDLVLPSSTPVRHKTQQERSASRLDRLPSFDSLTSTSSQESAASSIRVQKTTSSARATSYQEALGRLEHENVISRQGELSTPRASINNALIPTDTVLAQHVRDIQVPNTIAKEYRASNKISRPANNDGVNTPPFGRTKGDLTLKEQNGKIDKLTKENFDLKLKIHFLTRALQDRSSESVNNMISQNAQLQTDLVNARKDNQAMRRQMKALEEQTAMPKATFGTSQEEANAQSIRYSQLEADILYLQDTMRSLEEENRKLTVEEQSSVAPPLDRNIIDQLRLQNADLKRDLNAQASMLSSRDREREKLRWEIENLKLAQIRASPRPSTRNSVASSYHLRPDTSNSSADSAVPERLRTERDDALARLMAAETQFEQDNEYAMNTIEDLDDTVLQKTREVGMLTADLRAREDDIHTLQLEIQSISAGLDRIAEDREASQMTIKELERDVLQATAEVENLEKIVVEVSSAKERLEVQQDSLHDEVSFLREEQANDQIKISEITAALEAAESGHVGGKQRLHEVAQLRDEINRLQEEADQSKRSLVAHENDAKLYQDKLNDLENGLRETLDSVAGSSSDLLAEVAAIQRGLAGCLQQLERTRHDAAQTDRLLSEREALLEAAAADNRQYLHQLDRGRQSYADAMHELNSLRSAHAQRAPQLAAWEAAREQDRQALREQEARAKAELHERHELFLELWTRLRRFSPTPEDSARPILPDSLSDQLPGFASRLLAAADAAAAAVARLQARVESTEQELSQDVAALAMHLDTRGARLAKLEALLAARQASSPSAMSPELARLRSDNEQLSRELLQLKQSNFTRPGLAVPPTFAGSADVTHLRSTRASAPAPGQVGMAGRQSRAGGDQDVDGTTEWERNPRGEGTRPQSSIATTGASLTSSSTSLAAAARPSTAGTSPLQAADAPSQNDALWVLRLREMEKRLRQEREGRLLDRDGARKRLEDGRRREGDLKAALERERVRRETWARENAAADALADADASGARS